MTTLPDMIRDYQALLEEKENLAERTKENNAAIEAAKEQIAQQMVDDDMPEITYKGYSFKLTPKTSYTKKSEADIAAAGVDFFDVLREEGLGDIIVETVNARTLQSTISAVVEGSCASRAPPSSSARMRTARVLPSSTPHWSKLLIPQITPSTKVLCS